MIGPFWSHQEKQNEYAIDLANFDSNLLEFNHKFINFQSLLKYDIIGGAPSARTTCNDKARQSNRTILLELLLLL